jgi:hypothetical protein
MENKKKGGGGSSHQRAVLLAAGEAPAVTKTLSPPSGEKSRTARLVDFFEHPWVLWPFGVIGGIVGLIYTPFLFLFALSIMGALHRAEVVKGMTWKVQLPCYILIFAITSAIAYGTAVLVKGSADKAAHEMAAEVVNLLRPKNKTTTDPNYPKPKGPGIRMEGTIEPASSTMCQGMPDDAQVACLCPSPLTYTLKALPAPSDNNYSTEIDIKKVDKPIYRLRIFSRAQMQRGAEFVAVPPIANSGGSVALVEMAYDPFSFAIHSSVPKDEFKLEVHSAEGLRLKCINQEN